MSWILLVSLLLLGAFSYRYGWWIPAVDYRRPRILMYHMVSAHQSGQEFKGLRVPPLLFERQVRYLSENGWQFVTMTELMTQENVREKTVAITFDDGYEDNYIHALPVLKKYQAKATLYLVVDRHGRDWSVNKKAHHNTGELARESKLSDAQLREMLDSGVFELGAHSLTHVNLKTASPQQRQREIIQGKQQLETQFATTVTSFAYPFGIYEPGDVAIARDAGYLSAVTTVEGVDVDIHANRLELKRVKISGKDNFLAFVLRLRTGRRGWRK
jgi:peptidoglycan/xylan/chitin deacetylase (PgdA/CDA1 family)